MRVRAKVEVDEGLVEGGREAVVLRLDSVRGVVEELRLSSITTIAAAAAAANSHCDRERERPPKQGFYRAENRAGSRSRDQGGPREDQGKDQRKDQCSLFCALKFVRHDSVPIEHICRADGGRRLGQRSFANVMMPFPPSLPSLVMSTRLHPGQSAPG